MAHAGLKLRSEDDGAPSVVCLAATAGFTFSGAMWRRIATEYWERRPVLIKQPFRHAIISPKGMFAAVVNAAASHSKGERDAVLAFQIEGKRVEADPRKFLPRRGDQTMSGYADRLARMLRGRRFALIVEEIQMEAPQVWLRFREFLHGLSRVGMVPARVKASVFVGNYKIIRLACIAAIQPTSNSLSKAERNCTCGRTNCFAAKRILPAPWMSAVLLSAATTLEGHPGDIIYWPSDRWHVGECLGGLAVSVSLALYIKERPPGPSARVTRLNCTTSSGFALRICRRCPDEHCTSAPQFASIRISRSSGYLPERPRSFAPPTATPLPLPLIPGF